jgi:hypothetical protein
VSGWNIAKYPFGLNRRLISQLAADAAGLVSDETSGMQRNTSSRFAMPDCPDP